MTSTVSVVFMQRVFNKFSIKPRNRNTTDLRQNAGRKAIYTKCRMSLTDSDIIDSEDYFFIYF